MRDRSRLGFTTHYSLILQCNYLTGNYIYGRTTWKTPEHSAARSSSPSPSETHDKISASSISKRSGFSCKTQTHTHSINNDWIWGPCGENKAQSFGPLDQRSLVWWRSLVNDLVILPLRDHRVAHCHHCQELADLRWGRLKDTQSQHVAFLISVQRGFGFRKTYVVPLDVLDESRVVELGRVIAAGRQVAARQQQKTINYRIY